MFTILTYEALPMPRRHAVVRAVGMFLILGVLSGCGSLLSSSGPSIQAIRMNSDDVPYSLIDLSAVTIKPYMRPREQALSDAVSVMSVPDVRLVPGDVLRVLITDDGGSEKTIFAPLASGGTVFQNVRVDSAGRISLPYVGSLSVHGKTLGEVETLIRNRVRGRASEPQVHLELTGDVSGSVLVAGAVKAPGRFSALEGPLTLLDAINRAGGPIMEPHLARVVLRTGQSVSTFNYEDLLGGRNQMVPPHSEIVLERARKRFVAMGAVTQPGIHDLPSNNPSLLEVLGTVGGLKDASADASGVFIFRLSGTDDADESVPPVAEVFRLNMRDPAAMFLARQFLMQRFM